MHWIKRLVCLLDKHLIPDEWEPRFDPLVSCTRCGTVFDAGELLRLEVETRAW